MILVTDRARDRLRTLRESTPADRALRLETTTSGVLGIALGGARRGDYAIEHDGVTILLVAPELAARLAGARLDCKETTSGRRLVISAPRNDAPRGIGR